MTVRIDFSVIRYFGMVSQYRTILVTATSGDDGRL